MNRIVNAFTRLLILTVLVVCARGPAAAAAEPASTTPTTAMATADDAPSTAPALLPGAGKRFAVISIDGPLLSRHGTVVLKRGIDFARNEDAALVVIYLNTPGGQSTIMIGMRDAIIECPIPTLGYVRQAYSAGALLALATDDIYMHPAGHIGDAIPIFLAGGEASAPEGDLKEKIIRPMVNEFRTTARINGHPEDLAEAMVDRDFNLKEWDAGKGRILVLDAPTAVKADLAEGVADSVEDAVAMAGLAGAQRIDYQMTTADKLASFLSTGMASILLIAIVIGGIVIEVKTPGFGVGGIIAIAAIFLFFWANWYANLAHWLEVVLFLAGVGLIVAEVTVVPGFGIFGISGILCVVASIFLAMFRFPPQGFDFDYSRMSGAVHNMAWALVIGVVGMFIIARSIHSSRIWRRVSLGDELAADQGYTSFDDQSSYVGQEGVLLTDLRPVGTVRVGDKRLDALADGEFLNKGTKVRVIRIDGAQLVVEKVEEGIGPEPAPTSII